MPVDHPFELPELAPTGAGRSVIRLPEVDNVPVTRAVMEVIDHPHFQRLRRVRQLGPTCMVYPGAVHTRFEHSVGVYGTTVRYLQALLQHAQVRLSLEESDVRVVLMAALLHDVGHYPFAHTLEAVHHPGYETPRHEELVREIILGRSPGLSRTSRSLAWVLENTVGVPPERVIRLITLHRDELESPVERFLQSIISSALDVDKMDYLWRDSVHLGVPYGRGYDRERLVNSLVPNREEDGLAVMSKGVISAEMFIFSRYIMFSEVYWHHAVRSLSAMLERTWASLVATEKPDQNDLISRLLSVGDDELLRTLVSETSPGSVPALLLAGLGSDRRRPYKRVITWSQSYGNPEKRQAYDLLHTMDASTVETLVHTLRDRFSGRDGPLADGALLLDIPPRDKDAIADVEVYQHGALDEADRFVSLLETSRIVSGIGEDFVAVVKKIRLFVHPDYAARLKERPEETEAIVNEEIHQVAAAR